MKNIPILSYFTRYWILLTLLVGGILLWVSPEIYQHIGGFIELPMLYLGAWVIALLARHVFNFDTSDADAHSNWFSDHWKRLPDETRIRLTVYERIAYLLGACLIAAAIAK
ncbi:MAG: hypothetical protein ABI254_02920 [Chthoniobacterales bacterium]